MNDDLSSTIKQIADMLNQDKLPNNLKDIISLFASSAGSSGSTSPIGPTDSDSAGSVASNSNSSSLKKLNQSNNKNELNLREVNKKANTDELTENLEMLRTINNIMSKLNSNSDPRVNLLNALRPFLNSNRQKRVGNCIMLLKVTSILEIMKDIEDNKL